MEKNQWLQFLNSKIKAQALLENSNRLQVWLLSAVTVFFFGWGFSAAAQVMSRSVIFEIKVLFLVLSHVLVVLCFYMPVLLERGERAASKVLEIRDLASLTVCGLSIALFTVTCMLLSLQLFGVTDREPALLFQFAAWINVLLCSGYLAAGAMILIGLCAAPHWLVKGRQKLGKAFYIVPVLHLAASVTLGWEYIRWVGLGSQYFFEELRTAFLFIAAFASLMFAAGKSLIPSRIPRLAALEFETASGRLERHEDILFRYREAYASSRLLAWINRLSVKTGLKAGEIDSSVRDAMHIVEEEKPKEQDLRKVEELYKKANGVCRGLEKMSDRFIFVSDLLHLSEAEKEKKDVLIDQLSRELRNCKLDLSAARKKIDEKLLAIKNSDKAAAPEVPVQKVPLSN